MKWTKRVASYTVFIVFFLSIGAQVRAESGWTGNFNVVLGKRYLEDKKWEPVDQQSVSGTELDLGKEGWPLNVALDLFYAWEEEDVPTVGGLALPQGLMIGIPGVREIETKSVQVHVGGRKIWEGPWALRPFIGGGVALEWAELQFKEKFFPPPMVEVAEGRRAEDDDFGVGLWLQTGVYATLMNRFNLGVEGRWSQVDLDMFGRGFDDGSWHVAALVGVHW